MNKKQYNNIIENTLKHEQTDDSLSTARAIFDNMGVALPQGDIKTVYETISTDNYMGWKPCTMQEAKAAADNGTAAIGITEDRIVVFSAKDEEQPVTQTASVMSLDESTSAFALDGLKYYSYSYGTTNISSIYFANETLEVDVGWSGYNSLMGSTMSTIYWGTSDSSIAEIDNYGYITTHKCGTVTIYAYAYDGYSSASFQLTINPYCKRVGKTEGFTWQINEGGIASYIIDFSLTCKITEVYSNRVKIERISAFIHTDKNDFALGAPDLSVGTTTLGNTVLNMGEQESLWLDPDWIWGKGLCTLNSYVNKGTVLHSIGIAMLNDSPYGYRDIELELTI